MAKPLKLRGRLILGYMIPALLFIGLTALVYSSIRQVFTTFKTVERVQSVIMNVNGMERGAQGMIRSFRGYLALGDQEFLTEYEQYLDLFQEESQEVEPLIERPDQKERLHQLVDLAVRYNQLVREGISLYQGGKASEANAIARSATKLVNQFDELSLILIQAEQDLLKQETEKTEGTLYWLFYALGLGGFLILIASIFVALWIAINISSTIHRATQSIATSSTEIAATVEEQERMASQQASSVHETTTTMDELSASSKSTAEQAEATASGARQALVLTEGGQNAVGNTLEGMEILKEKVEAIAQQILRLSEQTNQIGNISELVSDLANQTNMLALNAAVEAVRAGEHGKGFAVVATEIRKLADESRKSALRINTLVADIKMAINSTVMATEEGTKTVQSGVEIAQETAHAFAGVAEAVNRVVLNNQQISLNIQQQVKAVEQVLEAMNALNQSANETANGLAQTKLGMQKLNEVALELNSIV